MIPGGAHTYSRGRDQFPLNSPSGIARGKGVHVWDIDGNCLIDWTMGLLSVSLGHAFDPVTRAVQQAIEDGVNFQRPTQLEMETARQWLDITGHDMIKYARHGSSVTTAAIKLSRGYTGRGRVAVPRQQPFFSFDDWFIGSTACDRGIPEDLKKYTLHFDYNDLASLAELFALYPDDIAAVILEPVKFAPPNDGFLEGVRELCTRHGAVLIFDEMICGLKFGFPGAQTRFGIQPDISTWGKGIGNGFPIAALTGKAEIMRLGGLEPEGERKLFLLSSTHGGESVGLSAHKATVAYVRDNNVVSTIWETGAKLQASIASIIEKHKLGDYLEITGYPCLPLLVMKDFESKPSAAFGTLMMQEMIAQGILFQGVFMVTPSHQAEQVAETLTAFDAACVVYKAALEAKTTDGFLEGEPTKPVFRKFN
ncbi:glutamate-1-semialdehyde 2,1-aminomutase [Insolitispirillum peregrinum]